MSIVLKSRATLSILANRAKPNTIEMTDKVKEHMENTSLRSFSVGHFCIWYFVIHGEWRYNNEIVIHVRFS